MGPSHTEHASAHDALNAIEHVHWVMGYCMTSVVFWLDSYVMALAAIGRVLQACARTVLQLVIQEYWCH